MPGTGAGVSIGIDGAGGAGGLGSGEGVVLGAGTAGGACGGGAGVVACGACGCVPGGCEAAMPPQQLSTSDELLRSSRRLFQPDICDPSSFSSENDPPLINPI